MKNQTKTANTKQQINKIKMGGGKKTQTNNKRQTNKYILITAETMDKAT